ncbi:SLATT domain-containing protein [Streptomyces sp. NPDC057499]|uniref:SLATT domain-containing protein n=1 Tax=Streptomyces sp. NPDC057499 TaxID=3346150 RepID=UPI0036864C5B
MEAAYPILVAVGVGSLIMLVGVLGGVFLVIALQRSTRSVQREGEPGVLPGDAAVSRGQVPAPHPVPAVQPLRRERLGMMEGTPPDTAGRVNRLLEHKKSISEIRVALRIRTAQTVIRWLSGTLAVVLLFTFIVANVAVGWSAIVLANKIAIPIFVLSAGTFWGIRLVEENAEGHYEKKARELKIELEAAEELRLLDAARLGLPVPDRQYSYKDSIPAELDGLRKDGRKYRRKHNVAQAIIILGSLGGTSVSALADTPAPLKYWAMGITFAVAAAAGFAGYYKWRERAFYLQQTADDIERHATAFDLGIYPYDEGGEHLRLAKLAKEIELLRVEQRKREQQLDQPHEGSSEVV